MNRNLTLDTLKVVLAFCVVGLHGAFLVDINPEIGYLLQQGLFRSAVPVFLIISGYYFFRADTHSKELKFIGRLLLLYTIWYIIYIPFCFKVTTPFLSNPNTPQLLLHNFFEGSGHLWYIMQAVYALIALSLLRRINEKLQIATVILLAVAGLILQYNKVYDFFNVPGLIDVHLYRNAHFFCLPFIYIGYHLHRHKPSRPKISMLVIGALLILLEAYTNYHRGKGAYDIMLSLYIFCPLLFWWAANSTRTTRVKYFAQMSVAIYLVHYYFLRKTPLFDTLIPDLYHRYTLLSLSALVVSILTSLVLILINRKVKYLL